MKDHRQTPSRKPCYFLRILPPKDEAGVDQLFATVSELKPYAPTYVSVTWGAGGSTRRLTIDLVRRIQRETGIDAMAHLTCVGATQADIKDVLDQIHAAGIENVLPLRGDPPRGETTFKKTEGGFGFASELVAFTRKHEGRFCLAGACYPETHSEAESPAADLEYLKQKVDAGVDFLITQLFFDNADYFFVRRTRAPRRNRKKIIAGIWPITNLSQIKRITGMCGATIPKALLARLEGAKDDPEAVRAVGVEHAVAQCRELVDRGAPGIHFYTLNRSRATVEVLEALKKR